jgi:hypothetical protein
VVKKYNHTSLTDASLREVASTAIAVFHIEGMKQANRDIIAMAALVVIPPRNVTLEMCEILQYDTTPYPERHEYVNQTKKQIRYNTNTIHTYTKEPRILAQPPSISTFISPDKSPGKKNPINTAISPRIHRTFLHQSCSARTEIINTCYYSPLRGLF